MLAFVDHAARSRDAALSAAQRKTGGVVHTPVPLARAMVREADALLARHHLPPIGSGALQIVDPATGPGIFLAATLASARATDASLLGVDLDPHASSATRRVLAAFALARGFELELERRDALATAHEAREGRSVLVLGNPPWSARGLGPPYVEALVRDFHQDEHGAPLRERRRGVLADAYVRFLRWSIDAVERAPGGGAIALVTNASYLDGPVHRGVRAALASRFDEVTIVDLGGSALVARAPGTIDENVFGVRPSVAIVLAARGGRTAGPTARRTNATRHLALHGRAHEKLALLDAPVHPRSVPVGEPASALRPTARREARYTRWPSLAEWFSFHAEGVQTNRDDAVVDRDRDVLLARLESIARGRHPLAARDHFDPVEAVRALCRLRDRGELASHVAPLAYRPFDTRFAFLHTSLCHRPRPKLRAAMERSSLALVSVRQDRGALPWSHVALVRAPIDNCYLSARSSCRARAFPSHDADGASNVSMAITDALARRGLDASPETLLAYVAAVLSAPSYTTRFRDALALDYPRVPLPRDRESLESLAAYGLRLAEILGAQAEPVRVRVEREVTRVGHHAFDVAAAPLRALHALRERIDAAVRSRSLLD